MEQKLLQAESFIQDHFHNGNDASRVDWSNLSQKKLFIEHTIIGADAATAANYGVFWIAPASCFVSGFMEVHQTAGTDGGTVTVTLEKLATAQAPDSGTAVLSSAISLKATANTTQYGTISPSFSARNLARGERLGLKDAGTLTSVANVTVVVEITIT